MLRSGVFWAGVAAGAALTWFWRKRQGQLIVVAPMFPRPLTRKGRRGQGWPGQQDAYSA